MRNGVLQSIFSLPASEDRHFLYISQYRFSRGKNFHINRKLELWHSLAAEVRLVGARLMCGVRTEQWSVVVLEKCARFKRFEDSYWHDITLY
jgi:hypothetical protein